MREGGERTRQAFATTARVACVACVCARLATMRVLVKPRVQKDKWSLYWKTTMGTKTEVLDELVIDAEPSTTAAGLKALVAKEVGWAPVDTLMRLEGFEEPWELAIHKGVELKNDATLSENGIAPDATIVVARKVLIAEGALGRKVPPPLPG